MRPAMKPTIGFLRPRLASPSEKLGRILFGAAADLADHDDGFGLRRPRNNSSISMNSVPFTGSPPMPTALVWPSPSRVVWNTAS